MSSDVLIGRSGRCGICSWFRSERTPRCRQTRPEDCGCEDFRVRKPELNRFEERNGRLYINGLRVLRGWESFTGWFWFAVEKVCDCESVLNGKPVRDTIWFGLVQGLEEEWGEFSEAEIEALFPKTWRIPDEALPWSGRRGLSKLYGVEL